MKKPTLIEILLFWMPLAATWFMMSVEGPYIAAIVARLPDTKINLAAFGVAISLAIFIESPIIMMMTAATTLIKDKLSYLRLRNFNIFLNAIITILMIILVIEPVFYFITKDLMQLPTNLIDITRKSTLLFLPWPAAIGFRRFYQGVLIKYGETRKVAYGTVTRLMGMSITAFSLFFLTSVPGALIGAMALSVGVVIESIVTWIMAHKAIHYYNGIEEDFKEGEEEITYSSIWTFYFPLLLTSLIMMGARPFITFFMARAASPMESLAVLPVVSFFVFMFRSTGMAYQEVVITLLGDKRENQGVIKKFAIYLGTVISVVLLIIAVTPLAGIWFGTVSGLTKELVEFARLPLFIVLAIPALEVLVNYQRGIIVHQRKTRTVTIGSILELSFIILTAVVMIAGFDAVGVVAAAASFLVGRIAVNIYYQIALNKINKTREVAMN